MLDSLSYFFPAGIYFMVLLLTLLLPARWVDGYAINPKNSRPYRYRLNGILVYCVALSFWGVLCYQGWIPWNLFYLCRWQMAIGACSTGLIVSSIIVFMAPRQNGSSLGKDFYFGRLDNPQWKKGMLDMKLCLYLCGAVMLALNTLSFAAHHWMTFRGDVSPGVVLYTVLFMFFVSEYVVFEKVHLYTYDFLAEKLGFKLAWGCLAFYPFYYQVGLWGVAHLPNPNPSPIYLTTSVVLFFMGWSLARGANLQKYYFKRDSTRKFLGVLPEKITHINSGRTLLINGFWGVARHVNYLGEILMGIGLAMSLGHPENWVPWLYPVYYIFLLFPRQMDDDRRCKNKYGALWEEYCKRVPYKIVPFIY